MCHLILGDTKGILTMFVRKKKYPSGNIGVIPDFITFFAPSDSAKKVMKSGESQKTLFTINTGSETKQVWIPNSVKDIFLNEAQIPEGNDTATIENISHVAMLLFAGYVDAATSISVSYGGGGSSPSSGWGKKDDEDDRQYAHRCLQMAHAMCKPPRKRRSFHR